MTMTIEKAKLIVALIASLLFLGAFAPVADARRGLTKERLRQVVAFVADKKEVRSSAIIGWWWTKTWWTSSCRVTARLRGRCFVDYEFKDGSACTDVIRVRQKSVRNHWAFYWSDSDGHDTYGKCTAPWPEEEEEGEPYDG